MKKLYSTFVLIFVCAATCLGQSYSITTINPGFEECDYQGNCPGWQAISIGSGVSNIANAPYNSGDPVPKMEIWYNNMPSPHPTVPMVPSIPTSPPPHKQFIELNSDRPTYVYQDYNTPCATTFIVSFYHRGRNGVDVCKVSAGPPGGPFTDILLDKTTSAEASDGTEKWGHHIGWYNVPAGQTTTRFRFEAVRTAGSVSGELNGLTIGNFLDDISFTGYVGIIGANEQTINCTSDEANFNMGGDIFTGSSQDPSNPSTTQRGSNSNGDGTTRVTIKGFQSPGTYKYTIITPCADYPITVHVLGEIPNTPTASSNSPVFQGDDIKLSTSQVGVRYTWSGPKGFYYSGYDNPVIIPNAGPIEAGEYTLVTTSPAGGCQSYSVKTQVVVNLLPDFPEPANVCEGSPLILKTSTSADEYIWRRPDGSQIPNSSLSQSIIYPISDLGMDGVYSLQVRRTAGLSGAATATIKIYNTPSTPTINADLSVFEGASINLSTDLISNGQYQWNGPNGFSSTVQKPTISDASQSHNGTYSLVVTTNGCPSPPATVVVTVNPTTPTIQAGVACQTYPIFIQGNTTTPNPTYHWIYPNGSTSNTTDNMLIIPNSSPATDDGIYMLQIIAQNGNRSPIVTTSVLVNPLPSNPVIDPIPSMCAGGSITLSTTPVMNAIYLWENPLGNTLWSSFPFLTLFDPISGTYSLTVYSKEGCPSSPATINMPVYPIPSIQSITSNSPVCSGKDIVLTATISQTGGSISYTWKDPSGIIIPNSSNSPTITIANATTAMSGTYSLLVSRNGCTSTLTSTTVLVYQTPLTPTIITNSPVFVGGVVALSSSVVNGTGISYTWTRVYNFLSATYYGQYLTQSATIAGSYTYTLQVSNNGCPSPITSTVVYVIPITPTITAPPVCEGSNLVLSTTAIADKYTWTEPSGATTDTTIPTLTIPNAVSSTITNDLYALSVWVNGIQSPVTSTHVLVYPNPITPTINLATQLICTGNSITLSAVPVAGATYFWTGPGVPVSSNTATIVIPPSATTTAGNYGYSLSVSVNNCPSPVKTISVAVKPTPAIISLTSNSPVCSGNNIKLDASVFALKELIGGGFTTSSVSYTWKDPAGNPIPNSSNSSTISIPAATTARPGFYPPGFYSLVIRSEDGCPSAVTSTYVQVNQTPDMPIISANPAQPVCAGEGIVLSTTPVTGATYTWSGAGIVTANTSTITIPPSATASMSGAYTYALTVSVNNCPSPAGTIAVVIKPIPVIQRVSAPALICTGNPLSLDTDFVSGAMTTYKWEGPNGFSSALQNPIVSISSTVEMSGSYTLTTSVDGCPSVPKSTYVEVIPFPVADAGPDLDISENDSQKINGRIQSAVSYQWEPSTYLDDDRSSNPTVVNPKADIMYTLIATNRAGCKSTDMVNITVPIDVPNIFTPNDDGENEVWIIKGISGNPACEVHVYNRWGTSTFFSIGYSTPWDGTNMETKVPFPTGTYYYVIDPKNGKKIVTGYVAIIR